MLSHIGSKSGEIETVKNLLDRACPMMIDASCISILTTKVRGRGMALGSTSNGYEVLSPMW